MPVAADALQLTPAQKKREAVRISHMVAQAKSRVSQKSEQDKRFLGRFSPLQFAGILLSVMVVVGILIIVGAVWCSANFSPRGRLFKDLLAANPGLSESNLETSTGFSLGGFKVSDVNINPVATLSIKGGEITTLAPLSKHRVTSLRIKDVPSFSSLEMLHGLGLRSLHITKCPVENFAPIKRMKLRRLSVVDCPVENFSTLEGAKIHSLTLSDAKIKSLSFVENMPELVLLSLCRVSLEDYSPLAKLKKISRLDLSGSSFFDVKTLGELSLTRLNLSGTEIVSLQGIKASGLISLNISNTAISSLEPLRGMKLEHLNCSDTKITNLSVVRDMPLIWFCGSHIKVRDFTPLSGKNFVFVDLSYTDFSDTSILKDCTGRKLLLGTPVSRKK